MNSLVLSIWDDIEEILLSIDAAGSNISLLEDSDEKVCRLEKLLQKVALSDILNGYFPLTPIKLLNRKCVKIGKWKDLGVKERWAKEEETYKVLQKLRKNNQL